jgi:hypothetical protein
VVHRGRAPRGSRLEEEVGWKFAATPYALPSAVAAHRHLRDVLQAKGYEVHYSEFDGGHEVLCWRGSLAEGLIALTGLQASDPVHASRAPAPRQGPSAAGG